MDQGAKGAWSARLVDALTRRYGLALLLVLATAAGAFYWGAEIPIRSDMENLFPESSPIVQRAKRARGLIGHRSELLVLVGSKDRAVNRQVAAELADRLRGFKQYITSVTYKRDISFFEKQATLYLSIKDLKRLEADVSEAIASVVRAKITDDFDDGEEPVEVEKKSKKRKRLPSKEEIKRRYKAGALSAYFESPDGQVIGIKAFPNFKPADARKALALTQLIRKESDRLIEKHRALGLTITVEGEYSKFAAAVEQIKIELRLATGVALGAICLILMFFFRRIRAFILVLVPLLVALMWTLLAARGAVGYLNIITAFIFAILLGLGIDFLVHGASRVEEEFNAGRPLKDALIGGLSRLGPAMIGAAMTTVGTFAVLTVFDFRGFSQFGAIAAMGVALCLVAVYVVLPPLTMSLARIRPPRALTTEGPALETGGEAEETLLSTRGARIVLVFFVVLAGAALYAAAAAPGLGFDRNTRGFRPKVSKKASALSTKYRKEAEVRSYAPALVVTGGLEETERLHRHLEAQVKLEPLLESVKSVYSLIPEGQGAKLAIVREIRRKVRNKYDHLDGPTKKDADRLLPHLKPTRFGPADLPEWVRREFTDTRGGFGRYVLLYFTGSKADAGHALKIYNRFGEMKVDGKTFHSTASYYILAETYRVMTEEGPRAVLLACLVILILLSLDFRNVRDVLTVFLPLVVSFVLFLGVLAVADIPLNMFNIILLPAIFGIGVDTTIHLVHRLNEGCGLRRMLRTTGKAAFVSSLTTAAGFLSLLFSIPEAATHRVFQLSPIR